MQTFQNNVHFTKATDLKKNYDVTGHLHTYIENRDPD